MPWRSAAIAPANSACSRIKTPGRHSSQAAIRRGSIARTFRRPKISPTTIALASSGDTVGTRPQASPSSSSGGFAPSQNG